MQHIMSGTCMTSHYIFDTTHYERHMHGVKNRSILQIGGSVVWVCCTCLFREFVFPFIVGHRVDLPFENDVNVILWLAWPYGIPWRAWLSLLGFRYRSQTILSDFMVCPENECVQFGTLLIGDLRKSRGLRSVRAFRRGPLYIGPCLRV